MKYVYIYILRISNELNDPLECFRPPCHTVALLTTRCLIFKLWLQQADRPSCFWKYVFHIVKTWQEKKSGIF